jgi:hypothetical protein
VASHAAVPLVGVKEVDGLGGGLRFDFEGKFI